MTFSRFTSSGVRPTTHRIFSTALTVSVLMLLVKLAAVGKELVVAHQFGTGDALDAFLIAFLLPSFFINVVAGSLNAAVIPTFVEVRTREGGAAAQRLFSGVMMASAILLGGVSAVLALLAPVVLPVLGSGFGPDKLALTTQLFYVLLPVLLASGLATVWGAVLNAGERFVLAALTPMAMPAVAVLVLVLAGEAWGIYALALGTVGGFVVEAGVLAYGLRRHGLSLRPRWHGWDDALRKVVREYFPMVAAASLTGGALAVDQAMAANLGAGSVAALAYGGRVVGMVLSVAAGLWTAVLPYFSQMVAADDWAGMRQTLASCVKWVLLVTLPLTAVLVLISEPLVRGLFERGAFVASDTALVSQVQAFYLLQIPFYILGVIGVRLLSSLACNRTVMWISLVCFVANVALNFLFMQFLGVAGISLATSVVYALSAALVYVSVRRHLARRVAAVVT